MNETNLAYHYTSQDGFKGIVQEDGIHLWFSDIRYMNDSSELINAQKVLSYAAKELLSENEIDQAIYNVLQNVKYEIKKIDRIEFFPSDGIRAKIEVFSADFCRFVCCFTKEADSLPMWNYYLKGDGNGYAIGIDARCVDLSKCEIVGQVKDQSDFSLDHEITPVEYRDEVKVNILKTEIRRFAASLSACKGIIEKETECRNAFQSAFEMYASRFKDRHFQYENELRMMATVRMSDKTDIDGKKRDDIRFRLSHGLVIPYFELHIPQKPALKAISISPRIGVNADNTAAIESMKLYLKTLGYIHDIDIRCSEIPLRYY